MLNHSNHLYEFGQFRLDVSERLLLKNQQPVALPPKAFEILTLLVRKPGRLIEKDELLKEVWPDSFVEEGSLSRNIYLLRKALGEGAEESTYIETVPRHGYRFIAEVNEIFNNGNALAAQNGAGARSLLADEKTETVAEESAGEIETAQPSSLPAANPAWTKRHKYVLPFLALVVALTALSVGLGLRGARHEHRVAESDVRSIAVLPFKPLGAEQGNELLGLGMADALIIKLSDLNRISVLPTSAVFKYTGRDVDSLDAGRELKVDAVLDGTVQRDGERVRVTAQLVRLSDGKTLWTGKFDEQFKDIFVMQDSISEQLAGALSIRMAGDERERMAKRLTHNTDAYQAYLRGLYHWNKRTKDGLKEAVVFLQQATEIDPAYALAYAYLADTYCMIVYYRYNTQPSGEIYQQARTAAAKALELDATLGEAHGALGYVKILFENDVAGATMEYQRAVELNPNSAVGRLRYAWMLVRTGQIDEAVRQAKRGQQLDPLSFSNNLALGQILIYARSPDEAINYFEMTRQIEPQLPGALSGAVGFGLGDAALLKGKPAEAIEKFQPLTADEGNRLYALGMLGYAYAVAGRKAEALKSIDKLRDANSRTDSTLYNISVIYGVLGQKEQAFQWLEKAIVQGGVPLRDLQYDYKLDALREDERYAKLLEQHKLEVARSMAR
jgi:DNA-binding winged helix-turn-helix (wHTH) protein/TolB-like protein/Flp pilus assembly protein TadD